MSGNLSYQVEHHLFPDMPSSRYQQIAPRVKEVCERYGLPYNTGPFRKQLGSVQRTILRLAFPGGKERPEGPPWREPEAAPAPARRGGRPGRARVPLGDRADARAGCEHLDEGGHDGRVELRAGAAQQLRAGRVGRDRALVRAVGRHGVERVADGDDARAQRDAAAGQAVGVAAAVVALVARSARCGRPARAPARARMRSPIAVWRRMNVHSSGSSGPGFCRMAAGTATLPMSCSSAASATCCTSLAPHAQLARRRARRDRRRRASGVQVRLLLREHPQQELRVSSPPAVRRPPLSRVHALVGVLQRLDDARGLARQQHDPGGG